MRMLGDAPPSPREQAGAMDPRTVFPERPATADATPTRDHTEENMTEEQRFRPETGGF
ncbi:hypothetical protein GCM10022252_44980 [Streptosporangium oxazolinicum]|uniref:Uncharacterized protein n=1 Tax=Streptosporangium oxazolinicum TaxID=909287 RepID=A0ABP8B332_9ACTN